MKHDVYAYGAVDGCHRAHLRSPQRNAFFRVAPCLRDSVVR